MKAPDFSKMTVEEMISARQTIDGLLTKRVAVARRELEDRLSYINSAFGNGGTSSGAVASLVLRVRSLPSIEALMGSCGRVVV